jgi:plasmid stabilization system protein ParE
MRIRVVPRAEREMTRAQRWWRRNRDKNPTLLEREIADAFELLRSAPEVGEWARNTRLSAVRRVLLKGTQYYLYYRADEDEIVILSLWHTSRGRGPRL